MKQEAGMAGRMDEAGMGGRMGELNGRMDEIKNVGIG